CRSLRPNGNDVSSEGSPTLATTRPTRISGKESVRGSKFAVTKIHPAGPGDPRITGGRVRLAVDASEIGPTTKWIVVDLRDIRPGKQRFATSALLSRKRCREADHQRKLSLLRAVREAGLTSLKSRRHPQELQHA